MSFIRYCVVLAAASFAILVGATSASGNTFGHRYLQAIVCCNGDPLWGTKAAIWTPYAPAHMQFPPGSNECMLARSSAEIPDWAFIQTGWVRCAPGSPGLYGGCSAYNSTLEYFVEIRPPGGGTWCHPRGSVPYNTNVYYSVRDVAPEQVWKAYIGGVPQPMDVGMGQAQFLKEGAEWTGGCDPFGLEGADFATGVAWQRWTGSSWFTVQASWQRLDCGWQAWGGPPPNEFGFWH